MDKEKMSCYCEGKTIKNNCHHGGTNSGAIYGLGVVGSLFYFLQGVTGFMPIVTGIGKAFFWPAFIVYKVLGILGL